jgi:hypothetical protein
MTRCLGMCLQLPPASARQRPPAPHPLNCYYSVKRTIRCLQVLSSARGTTPVCVVCYRGSRSAILVLRGTETVQISKSNRRGSNRRFPHVRPGCWHIRPSLGPTECTRYSAGDLTHAHSATVSYMYPKLLFFRTSTLTHVKALLRWIAH